MLIYDDYSNMHLCQKGGTQRTHYIRLEYMPTNKIIHIMYVYIYIYIYIWTLRNGIKKNVYILLILTIPMYV